MENRSIYKPKFWKPIKSEDVILNKSFFTNYGFDKHVHEEYAIGVVSEGYLDGFVDGSNRTINKKSIMTINPDTAHSNWCHKDTSYSQSALYLSESFLQKFVQENFESKQIHFKVGLLEDENLANELIYLANAYEQKYLNELEYECRLVEVLSKIFLINSQIKGQKALSKHELAIKEAKEFINDNLGENLSLDDISQELDISKYHFLRIFKNHTYFSPHSYLMLKRLEKAKQLLQKGISPAQVAVSCGFNDQSHLNKKFKSFVGLTSKEYQKFFI